MSTTTTDTPLLEVRDLVKTYPGGFRAVDGVSFSITSGQTLGIVGESGCGKSTTARMLLRLTKSDSGSIRFRGRDVTHVRGRGLNEFRSSVQFVPQNPRASLNPRRTIAESLAFPLQVQGASRATRSTRIPELLDAVGLARSFADRYPHQLSGGQLQRVAIARALSTGPHAIVCDEAVSALDKSVQAQVLNLLASLQRDLGLSLVFISHDLAVIEHISDAVVVMYGGRIVESGSAADIWHRPQQDYTRTLLSAIPGGGWSAPAVASVA